MPARLIESLATTGPLADLFSDDSVLQAMLDFEVALARAEARAGVVPKSAVRAIQAAAKASNFDSAELACQTLRAGTPGIPVAKALTAKVRAANGSAAKYVHWGATSQDVADTALVLLLKRAQPILDGDLDRLEAALRRLSDQHQRTVMLGRTLLQAAPPVTFGLKAAGWFAAAKRGRARMDAAFGEALVLQHLPQVRLIARRIHDRLPAHISLDDLISTGINPDFHPPLIREHFQPKPIMEMPGRGKPGKPNPRFPPFPPPLEILKGFPHSHRSDCCP